MSEWTAGRLKTFIISALRGAFRKYPPKYEVLEEAFVGKKVNELSGRVAKHYRCNSCKGHFPLSKVNVDHITPVVNPDTGFTTFDSFIENLFCQKEQLQVLCEDCHDKKTREENTQRKTTNVRKRNTET